MIKNRLLFIVIWLIQLFTKKNREEKRFLVVATTALGDTLWATPAIESLKRSFPDAKIGLLTHKMGLEIFEKSPYIDQIYLWDRPFKVWRKLKKGKYHTVLVFHASQRLVLPVVVSIGASKIVGTAGINKGLDSLLTDPMPVEYVHEIVRRLKMVERVGGKIFTEKLFFPLERIKKTEGKKLALHPGSKDSFKRWSAEKFIELGKKLQGYEIFLTGGGEEKELLEKVQRGIPGAKLANTGKNLKDLASFLSEMDLLISNDTGPVHLACAIGVPVIALYSSTDPVLCGPHQAEKAEVIYKKPTCRPCLKRKCKTPFCFYQIEVDEVVNLTQKSFCKLKIDRNSHK